MVSFLLYKIGEFLALCLPWNLAYRLGIFFSNLQFYISRKDRQSVINNLRIILPNEEEKVIRRKAREVFVNFGLNLVEFFRFSDIDINYVKNHFTFVGKEHLDNALKKGKGAILLTAHIGNWELGGMALSLLGYPIIAIALDHNNPKINEFFKKRRESKGMEVVPLGIAVKRCYEGLRSNKFIAILGDRDFSNSSYSMDFLGRRKNIPRGPAVLALRTGASIIPVFIIREGFDNFRTECLPPIEVSPQTDEKEIIEKYIKIIEGQVYKYPSQWLMFREFWKE